VKTHLLRFFQRKTDVRLQELLTEGDFPAAIQLLLEVQQAVKIYHHFTAIRQLAVKLQDTMELTEEQLDVALAKVCHSGIKIKPACEHNQKVCTEA